MASLFTAGKFQAIGPVGIAIAGIRAVGALPGAKLFTYAAGTTTPLATYTNQAGLSSNANPVVMDANGQADVWLGPNAYHMRLLDAAGVLVWDEDNIGASVSTADLSASSGSNGIGFIQAGTGAVVRTLQAKNRETVSVKDFGAVGDGVTDDTAAINAALQATLPVASVVQRRTILPAGSYKVTGTLYLRAGCELCGEGTTASKIMPAGLGSSQPIVRIGSGLISGVSTSDNSGAVPTVRDLFIVGQGFGVDMPNQSGAVIDNCWFDTTLGIDLAGSDVSVTNCFFDTSCITGIQVRGSRNKIEGCEFDGGTYGIVFSTPSFTTVSQTTITGCQFYGLKQYSAYAFSTAIIDDVKFVGCAFSSNYLPGTRSAGHTHFLTFAGATFSNIDFTGCTFEYALTNDVAINGGTGIATFKDCRFKKTGIVDGGASYTLATSIVGDQVANGAYMIRGCEFQQVGGASARFGAGTKVRISDCHNIGSGTGGTGLAASANEGDKAHFQIRNGAVDVMVSDCSTDASNLYVAGSFNTSYFHGRHNRSNFSYDTYSSTVGGTYYGERNGGGFNLVTVASATALTLPQQGGDNHVFTVTGTTNITSIVAAGWEGKRVTLIFTGILTMTDGSNLNLASNFVTTADDTITLVGNGSGWYEVCRSVN